MSKHHAFTLVELLLSMSVMSVIGLSVAALSEAIGDGYIASDGYYDAIQCGRNTVRRIEWTSRKAKLIIASSSTAVVFWAGDTNGDGLINLDEIKTVTFNSAAGEIDEVAVNFGNAPNKAALNVNVPLSSLSTVSAALAIQQASTYCVTTPLATSVSNVQMQVSPAAPLATRLDLQFTLGGGEQKLTLNDTAHLRADDTSNVGQSGNTWVLTP
jgi:prepilin-type N-terminal cleavage/methylation domain-containing protein